MTDDEFIASFEDCTLPADSFHHADHVKMAFLYLRRYPVARALQQFSASLLQFAASKGRAGLYHETITWAFLLLIHDRLARAGSQPAWADFAAENPDLLNWQDNVLRKYYRPDTLDSALAKRTFLFPDKV